MNKTKGCSSVRLKLSFKLNVNVKHANIAHSGKGNTMMFSRYNALKERINSFATHHQHATLTLLAF